jgi:hypothetical protein
MSHDGDYSEDFDESYGDLKAVKSTRKDPPSVVDYSGDFDEASDNDDSKSGDGFTKSPGTAIASPDIDYGEDFESDVGAAPISAANNAVANSSTGNKHQSNNTTSLQLPAIGDSNFSNNELDIFILKATGLSRDVIGNYPNCYIFFLMLDESENTTKVIPASKREPEFNQKFTFPMKIDDALLGSLKDSEMQFTLINKKGEEEDLIGDVFIPLGALAKGLPIQGSFGANDESGREVGRLHIELMWKHPFNLNPNKSMEAKKKVRIEEKASIMMVSNCDEIFSFEK